MSLLKRGGEGGTDNLGWSRLVAIADGEAGMKQAILHQIGLAIGDGLIDALAISDGALAGTGHAPGVVKTNHHRDR